VIVSTALDTAAKPGDNTIDTAPSTEHLFVDARVRVLLMAIRQAMIIALGAIEDYLEMERSIIPRRKRGKLGEADKDSKDAPKD